MTSPAEIWSSFTQDPRDPQHAPLRASDQDRVVVQQVLAEAYADGRLDREEYDERSDRAARSRTLGELPAILGDLVSTATVPAQRPGLATATPAEIERRALEAYATDRREAILGFLLATAVCTVIWLLTTGPGGFPWPAFVALGTGINVAKTVARKPDIVAREVRRLEKKQAKELGKPWTPDDEGSR